MAKVFSLLPWSQGSSSVELGAHSSTSFTMVPQGDGDGVIVERLLFATSCQDLVIDHIQVGPTEIAKQVSVRNYLEALPPPDSLVEKVLACFRYKDHSKEEILAAIRACSSGTGGRVKWPRIAEGSYVILAVHNPTAEPVRLQVTLIGQRYERLPAQPTATEHGDGDY